MPIFVVHTNVAKEDVPQELYSEATVELAKAMRLPEKVSLQILWARLPLDIPSYCACCTSKILLILGIIVHSSQL